MARILTVLFVALVFEALGVVLLKQGIDQVVKREAAMPGPPSTRISRASALRLVGYGVINPRVLLGILFEAIFFTGLLILMSQKDISFVWPLTSLSFVMTTFAAILILKEHVSGTRWTGVALIMIGAAFITWSEKVKEVREQSPPEISRR